MRVSVREWLAAAADPAIEGELRGILDEASREIERHRPICLASGHCCRFDEFGHDLFVTGLETAAFLRRAASEPLTRRPDGAASPCLPLPQLGGGTRLGRVCPWLQGRLCGARDARPLACRVFHCDPAARSWSGDLLERMHGRIRTMHERHGVTYHYGEWLRMLEAFAHHL